jgi:hypothetical protein
MMVVKETIMDQTYFESMQVVLAIAILTIAFGLGRYLGQYFR